MSLPLRVVGICALGVLLLVGGVNALTAPGRGAAVELLGARPVPGPGLAVRHVLGRCVALDEARATAVGEQVVVVLRSRSSGDLCTGIGVIDEVVLPLEQPLGDRAVVDEQGRPVPR